MTLKDALQSFLNDMGWDDEITFDPEANEDRLGTGLTKGGARYRLWIHTDEERHLLKIYLYCPFEVPEEKRAEADKLLARLNLSLTVGHFEIAGDDALRYRHAIDVEGVDPAPSLIHSLLAAASGAFDKRRMAALGALLFTDTPVDEVIRKFEQVEEKPVKVTGPTEIAAPEAKTGTAVDDTSLGVVLRYASPIAKKHGLTEVTADTLLAGAYLAHKENCLPDQHVFHTHMEAHRAAIELMLDEQGYRSSAAEVTEETLPLALDVNVDETPKEPSSDPLIVALNIGICRATRRLLKHRVAWHEAGHALVSLLLRPGVRLAEVSILDLNDSDGYVSYDSSCPYWKSPTSREDYLAALCVLLAGRVAEQIKFGEEALSSGASDDLERATVLAWKAIGEWGLEPEFGNTSLKALSRASARSNGQLYDRAQACIEKALNQAAARTKELLAKHWSKVEAVAQALKDRQKLSEQDVFEAIGKTTDSSEPQVGFAVLPALLRALPVTTTL